MLHSCFLAASLNAVQPEAKAKAKSKTMREQANAGGHMKIEDKAGEEEGQDEESQNDQELPDAAARDYNKAKKIAKMLKQGQLIADITPLFGSQKGETILDTLHTTTHGLPTLVLARITNCLPWCKKNMFLFFVRGLTSDLGLLLSLASPWRYSCNMIFNSCFRFYVFS